MKVIGISGSPRANGNTEILLHHALEPFQENGWAVVKFLLSRQTIAPCRGCDGCLRTNRCVIEDDMRELYEEFPTCDAVIVASPVYYRNVTAQLKAVFDRCYATKAERPLADKVGGAIVIGRGTGGGQGLALSIIYNFFLSSGAVCVPGELNGVTAVAGEPGEILTQPKRLRQARILGENVLRLAELLAKAKK